MWCSMRGFVHPANRSANGLSLAARNAEETRFVNSLRNRPARSVDSNASQRETKFDRALRRARKLRLRLGGDPTDDEYPDKPPRALGDCRRGRWATYKRLMDRLVAADGVTEERLKAARLLWATA